MFNSHWVCHVIVLLEWQLLIKWINCSCIFACKKSDVLAFGLSYQYIYVGFFKVVSSSCSVFQRMISCSERSFASLNKRNTFQLVTLNYSYSPCLVSWLYPYWQLFHCFFSHTTFMQIPQYMYIQIYAHSVLNLTPKHRNR